MLREIRRLFLGFAAMHPARQVALGYFLYALLGWLCLLLPVSHNDAAPTASALDDLFTAVSAVSTTGLVTVPTGETYSTFGLLVILVLIQLGGVGYMTAGSFVVLARRQRLPAHRDGVARLVFALPKGFTVTSLVKGSILFSLVIESIGFLALYPAFLDAGSDHPFRDALFHSVSAFCTAGLSTYSSSLEAFRDSAPLNLILAALSLLGAIGFIVMLDLWRRLTRRTRQTTITTRIIFVATSLLILVPTLLIFVQEPHIRDLPAHHRLLAAFFQAMTASTTVGFNTVPISLLSMPTTVLIFILMIIGASPAGTGGGLKVTSLTAAFSLVVATLRGHTTTRFLGRELPFERVRTAAANLVAYLFTLAGAVYFLSLTESASLLDTAFEAASALGTVGLSRGITPDLSPLGALIVISLMYLGRVGPVVMGMSLLAHDEPPPDPQPEDVAV